MRVAIIVINLCLILQLVSSNVPIDPATQVKIQYGIETSKKLMDDLKTQLEKQISAGTKFATKIDVEKYMKRAAKVLGK